MPWHDDMTAAMEAFFLSKKPIRDRISDRLFAVINPTRLVALTPNPTQQVPTPTAEFVEYDIAGDETADNLDAESDLNDVVLGFNFYAMRGKDARHLFGAFWDALTVDGVANRYEGAWNQGPASKTVQLARWLRDTYSETVDESVGMVVVTCALNVNYTNQE